MLIEVEKNPVTGKYEVTPDVDVSIITDATDSVAAFWDETNSTLFLAYKEDGTLAKTVAEFSEVKWWMIQNSGNGNSKSCYTTSEERIENADFMASDYAEPSVSTASSQTITINNNEVTIDGTTYTLAPVTIPLCLGFSMCTFSS